MRRVYDAGVSYLYYLKTIITKAKDTAYQKSKIELFSIINSKIKDMFYERISEFYSAYSPVRYNRTFSMYEMLETTDDFSTNEIFVDYNPHSLISSNRHGYSGTINGDTGLYDLVFRQGWHGGALCGDPDKNGNPHPGDGAYWRDGAGFSLWGGMAARSRAPLDMMNEDLRVIESRILPEQTLNVCARNLMSVDYSKFI